MTDTLEPGDDGAAPAELLAAAADWGAILVDYNSGQYSLVALAERHGVTISALKYRKRRDLWPARNQTKMVDRPLIIARMFRVLELQVRNLEVEMNKERDTGRTGEQEVALLGKLASNLEKLMALDGAAGHPPRARQTKDMLALRNKIAERLDQLKLG